MRILLWGINYAPEITGISPYNVALAEFLSAQGDDVKMLTTFAYYPDWKKRPEDRGRLFRTDEIRGVTVHRCWHYVPERVTALKRIAHEASFVLMSFLRALLLPRPQLCVVVSPPLLLGAAAWLLGKLRGVPFVVHVQDLQPDAAVGLGMLKQSRLTRALFALEAFNYRHAVRVGGISPGMLDAYRRKGVPEEKIVLFPNGVDRPDPARCPPRGRFRARCDLPRNAFLAVYAGNLGVKQGLDVVVQAAAFLRSPNVHLVICGDGARRPHLAELIAADRTGRVHLRGLQYHAEYDELLADADLMLITEQRGAGQAFFPSKLLGILAAGRAVLAVADERSELSRALRDGEFGAVIEPDDPRALAEAVESAARDPAALAGSVARGEKFLEGFYFDRVLPAFRAELERVVATESTHGWHG